MAKQKSLLKIEGTLDGLTFYRDQEGNYLVRTKGGVSKSRIENDPAFVRTRENGKEFGHIANTGKRFRRAIASLIYDVPDKTKVYRLTRTLNQVKKQDSTSDRGERKVAIGLATPEGKEALKYFDFNAKARMDAVLRTNYSLDVVAKEIEIDNLVPIQNLGIPQGATHFELSAGLLNYDLATDEGDLAISNVENLMIDNNPSNINLNFANPPSGNGIEFFFLKIAFFQELNAQQYPLNNGAFNALQIIEIQ